MCDIKHGCIPTSERLRSVVCVTTQDDCNETQHSTWIVRPVLCTCTQTDCCTSLRAMVTALAVMVTALAVMVTALAVTSWLSYLHMCGLCVGCTSYSV